jgi:hypothetical protein
MERLEAKQVKGHTYYYYSKWAGSTIAVDASGRNTSANSRTSSWPFTGVGQRLFAPRSCRIHQAGLDISLRRLLSQLEDIREVINLYPKRRKAAKMRQQTVLTRKSKVQKRLVDILGLEREGGGELG